jgi:hexosaminidase
LSPPRGPSGELEVRLDACDGPTLASLSLAPALEEDAVTRLPAVQLSPQSGTRTLCFTFTGSDIDPMWALDRVELRAPTSDAPPTAAVHAP